MNVFAISSILTFITTLGISLFLYLKGRQKLENRLFIGVPISGALWGLGSYMAMISTTRENIFLWWQIAYVGGIVFSPIFYFHFVCAISKINKKFILICVYLLGIIFSIFIIFYRDLFFGELVLRYNQFYWFYWPKSKSFLYLSLYIGFYWILLGYAFILLLKFYKKSSGVLNNQLKYFLIGSIIGWLGAEGDFLPKFIWNAYPYTNFLIAIYPTIFVYAMLKYRLMDIKVAVTRAGLFIAIYTLVLGIPFALTVLLKPWFIETLGSRWWMAPLGLMAALATVGPFIYIYLQRRAEDRLLKEQRRYQDTLKQASVGMTRIRNLRKLLDLITHIVTKTVRISYAAIYLYNQETNEFVLQVSRDKGRISVPKLTSDNPLISWIVKNREPLIYEEVKRRMDDLAADGYKELEENMRLLTASVVIPSFLENRFMGFIVLGDKVSGQIYSPDDLNVFQVLASQAALAIENAQFYDEAKEMQEQIAQAEKMATIGTMADGLSHQINNRFYALSLIAGDSIDTIKMTDTTKCSPEIKEMIVDVSHALERIQANVMQGGEVVRGLLKYSRKGDDEFEYLNLNVIITNTLEMVQFKVKLSEIDIIRDFSPDIPKIKGNMAQLEEVFFNFIDNAYDSIVERRTFLGEPGYRGRIIIAARQKESVLEIVVEDNGMGIKDANCEKIFTPFFTTKTSARRGTGLGLYVIKRIIVEMHKGTILFESQHKIGTRFILGLPCA